MNTNNKGDKDKNAFQYLGLIGQIGFSTIVPILIGGFIGQKLDKQLGNKGIFSIIFLIIGGISGFFYLIRIVTKASKRKWANGL